ncbi:MAG: GNAT family N-acetyltransferase [Desulfobacterales bacterium]|nr:GNAT family N-acetyltransferase [Desulfobacterales bacterium]
MNRQSPEIIVQPFTGNYQPGVIDLILNIQQNEFNIPITADDQPDLKTIPVFYQKNKGNFWIALDGENVVGTISLLDIGNDQTALRKMFVDKNYRGTDIGTAGKLLKILLNWAEEQQIREIYLGTTPKFLAAHRFYEKTGFTEISKNDLPENFPIMKVDTKFYKYECFSKI